jgi:glycerol dehydrogenase-like iron-containing ADH family enzyme
VQLVAEGRPHDELVAHAAFARRLGLPMNLAAFGIERLGDDEADQIARITCTAPYIGHLRPAIDAAGVRRALETADTIGRG